MHGCRKYERANKLWIYLTVALPKSLKFKFSGYTTIRCDFKQVHIHNLPDLAKRPWLRWRSLVSFFKSDDLSLFQTWLARQDVTQLRLLFHCSGTVPWVVIQLCNVLDFRLPRFGDLLFQYLFYSPDRVFSGQRQLPFRVLSWLVPPVHQRIFIERSSSHKAHLNNYISIQCRNEMQFLIFWVHFLVSEKCYC